MLSSPSMFTPTLAITSTVILLHTIQLYRYMIKWTSKTSSFLSELEWSCYTLKLTRFKTCPITVPLLGFSLDYAKASSQHFWNLGNDIDSLKRRRKSLLPENYCFYLQLPKQ